MTKKHFKAIAEALAGHRNIDEIAFDLAKVCKADNPRFDAYRFFKAAGIDDYQAAALTANL